MQTDAHCHPSDLASVFPAAEDERRKLGIACVSSATTIGEFAFCEQAARAAAEAGAAPVFPCYAVHPQMPLLGRSPALESLAFLDELAAAGRLTAVGETGFDLFDAAYRETEKTQDFLFAAHLEAAIRHGLPLVMHVRRAMHKVFAHSGSLKKCRSVIFHSWSGTKAEGDALLERGINAYFSFGTTVALNHREAMRCCSLFPADRLLSETDAPFQPLRGRDCSSHADLRTVLDAISALRLDAGSGAADPAELENAIEGNFSAAFGVKEAFGVFSAVSHARRDAVPSFAF